MRISEIISSKQQVAETINPDILNKRFRHTQVIGDYTYKAEAEDFEGTPLLWIRAYDGNKEIGHILFEIWDIDEKPSVSHLESGGTEVDQKYRNKGVASTMYAYAKMLGNDIIPSSLQRSDGKAMWAAWQKSGAAKHLTGGIREGQLNELGNTSFDIKEPKGLVNTNDRKQTTYKVMQFKSGKTAYLIVFTMIGPKPGNKKQNWNALNVAFGRKEKQNEYSFGDEIDDNLTAKNKDQFLIYSTMINAIRKFITEYNTEVDEIIIQGDSDRQRAMYQRFFQSAAKYFPGWHYDGKHSLIRDVPRQQDKKLKATPRAYWDK